MNCYQCIHYDICKIVDAARKLKFKVKEIKDLKERISCEYFIIEPSLRSK